MQPLSIVAFFVFSLSRLPARHRRGMADVTRVARAMIRNGHHSSTFDGPMEEWCGDRSVPLVTD